MNRAPIVRRGVARRLAFLLPVCAVACGTAENASSPSDAAPLGSPSSKEAVNSVTVAELVPRDGSLTFEVPAGALGFTLAVAAPAGSEAAPLGIRDLRAPSGQAAVVDFIPRGGTRPLGKGVRGTAAVCAAWTTGDTSLGGLWSATTDAPKGASHRLLVQATDDGAFHGGLMDLDLYIPDGLLVGAKGARHPVDAATALSDADVSARVDAFFALLETHVGIARGEVTAHALDAKFLAAESGDARADLLAHAAPTELGRLAVAFTNSMSYTDGDPLYGYSLGLPGFAAPGAGARAAIAVALYEDSSAKNDAVTILHERGHFAGLMHTSEEDGTDDLLADTPTCRPKPGTCLDANNLMAPAGPKNVPELTASQRRVMQSAPYYRAYRRAAGPADGSKP